MLLFHVYGLIRHIGIREAELFRDKELAAAKGKLIEHILKLIKVRFRADIYRDRQDGFSERPDHEELLNS